MNGLRIVVLVIAALNIFAGFLPSETNNVDLPSLVNFIMAASLAYIAGDWK